MAGLTETEFLGTISTGAFNNDYKCLETLGKGGSGEVFKVKSKKDDHIYAVKRVRFDKHKLKNQAHFIKRELINNARLSHENVVRYYDSWVEVSANQTLARNLSYESETDLSSCSERHDDVTEEAEIRQNDSKEQLRNGNLKMLINKVNNTQEHSNAQRDIPSITDVDDNQFMSDLEVTTKGEITRTNKGNNDGKDRHTLNKTKSKEKLPDFTQLQMSFEEDVSFVEPSPNDDMQDIDIVFSSSHSERSASASPDHSRSDSPWQIRSDKNAAAQNLTQKQEHEYETEDEFDESLDSENISESDIRDLFDELSNSEHICSSSKLSKDANIYTPDDETNKQMGPRFLDLYIKMEFCSATLREALDKEDLVDDDQTCWSFFRQIIRGLDYIHSKGITHRDLTPRNIFITTDNVVKIGDFGLSRLHTEFEPKSSFTEKSIEPLSKMTHGGSTSWTGGVGTVWYTAPEVLDAPSCKYGHEVDLFSLGLIFFEMCHVSIKTEQEKASIFIPLRNERTFPDSFDKMAKEKQMNVIIKLLDKNPDKRVPLKTLLSSAEGFLPPEPIEETQFKNMLPLVISKRDGELFRFMMQELYRQTPAIDVPSVQQLILPESVIKLRQAFMAVAERHCVRQVHLPIFTPFKNKVLPVNCGDLDLPDQNVFLDSKGRVVELCDNAMAAFLYKCELEPGFFQPHMLYYSTNTFYRQNLQETNGEEYQQMSFFSMTAREDLLGIGRAILILQETIQKTGQRLADFVLCLTHRDIEVGLLQIYDLNETEKRFLYRLCELVGDTTVRLKVLKQLKETEICIPQILVMTGSVNKMVAKLDYSLGKLHKQVHGFSEGLAVKLRQTLVYLKTVKDIIEKFGVSIDLKLDLFMEMPKNGVCDSGIKFHLKSKPRLQTVAQGCHLTLSGERNITSINEFLWFEIFVMQLKSTDAETIGSDVVIEYDKTRFADVKTTAYLYGKLADTGLTVSELEKGGSDKHLSPYCKFFVQLSTSSTQVVLMYEQDNKVKRIPMKPQTVIGHIKNKDNIPYSRWLLFTET